MNCVENQEIVLDVLYAETSDPHQSRAFFQHLENCSECREEFRRLLDVRAQLTSWQFDEGEASLESPTHTFHSEGTGGRSWYGVLPRVAAAILIVFGLVVVFQYLGLLGGQRMVVSRDQLMELVRDMIVVEQEEERRLIGAALLEVKEEIDLSQRYQMEEVYRYLTSLEERYLEALEKNNYLMQTLSTR